MTRGTAIKTFEREDGSLWYYCMSKHKLPAATRAVVKRHRGSADTTNRGPKPLTLNSKLFKDSKPEPVV